MPYCPKCGNEVNDVMRFCSNCGFQLKDGPSQTAAAAPSCGQETPQTQKPQVHDHSSKVEHGFISFLAGGLILVTIGISAILELTNDALTATQYLVVMLTVIGLIVIFSAFYVALSHYRYAHAAQTTKLNS